jgi:regulator of ribosome biosynthesis
MAAGTGSELSTNVNRTVDVDTGILLAIDTSSLDEGSLRAKKDKHLLELSRECTQALFNEIWKLPMERPDESIVAVLPPPTTILPREKPIPKPKPLTKWELFAKRKGIKKTKRSQMVYDEISRKYKPRWGYKRVNDPKDDWLIEVPENADNNEDQFAKRDQERKERIAKNEYQRLRNVAGNQKRKLKIKGNWLIA